MADPSRHNLRVVDREAPDAAAPTIERLDPAGIGEVFRAARERMGIDIQAVSDVLRIRRTYLLAIEDERFEDLPGHTYAVGFVRAYAEFLELDGEDMVARFKEQSSGLARKTELVFPAPIPEGRFPGGMVLTAAIVLAAGAYGAWYYVSNRDLQVAEEVPPVPAELSEAARTAVADPETAAAAVQTPASEAAPPSAGSETASSAGASPPASGTAVPEDSMKAAADGGPAGGGDGSPGAAGPATAEVDTMVEPTVVAEAEAPAEAAAAPEAPAAHPADSRSEAAPASEGGAGTVPTGETAAVATAATETAATDTETTLTAAADEEAAAATGEGDTATRPSILSINEGAPADDASAEEADPRAAAAPEPTSPEGETNAVPDGDPSRITQTAAIPAAPAGATAPDAPRIYGEANVDARIVLRATDDSWVQVRDADQNVLLTRILRAGDMYRVPNRENLTLLTGNAGALQILVDGELVPALGPVGAVRRDVPLEPEYLRAGRIRSRESDR